MGTLITLFGLLFVAAVCVAVFAMVGLVMKLAIHAVLLPFKIILLPILAVVLIVKIALILTALTVALAVLLPLMILIGIIAAPFALIAALT